MLHDICGHKKQIAFLDKSIQIGKVAHAYVFAGPSFVGKKLVAKKFAQKLLYSDPSPGALRHPLPEGEGNKEWTFHPDFLEISGVDGVKIEQIRELIYKLSLRPYQAQYKIAVIDNAENMTVEAQNALLKVLEEPKSYTVIILVTSNPGKLLRTITSRAQKINFGPVVAEDYESLIPKKLAEDAKRLVLTFAAGRPGLATAISQEEHLVEKLTQIDSDFVVVAGNDLAEKLKLAYDLADMETPDLKQVLDFWLIRFEAVLAANPEIKNARNLAEVNVARRMLDQNVNSKLLLTNLMLKLS